MNIKKTILICLLFLATLPAIGSKAYASTDKNLSIYCENYKKLTIKTNQTVKWKVYGNEFVTYKYSEDHKSIIMIGKTAGNAKIEAIYGKNKVERCCKKRQKQSFIIKKYNDK